MIAAVLVGCALVIVAAIFFKISMSNKSYLVQNAALEQLRNQSEEYERGFIKQAMQLSMEASVEARLRARLIGVSYLIQGYIDNQDRTKKVIFPVDNATKWELASAVAAKPLGIIDSKDEGRLRSVAAHLCAELISAIKEHDLEALAACWSETHAVNGHKRGRDVAHDQRVEGWSLQSATAGMKSWADVSAL